MVVNHLLNGMILQVPIAEFYVDLILVVFVLSNLPISLVPLLGYLSWDDHPQCMMAQMKIKHFCYCDPYGSPEYARFV